MGNSKTLIVCGISIFAILIIFFLFSEYRIVSYKAADEALQKQEQLKRNNAALGMLNAELTKNANDNEKQIDELNQKIIQLSSNNPSYEYELKIRGYSGTTEDIAKELRKRTELIPIPGILGGTMAFRKVDVLSHKWIYAEFEDGHTGGALLLEYKIRNGQFISFEVLETYILGEKTIEEQQIAEELIHSYFAALQAKEYDKAFRLQDEVRNADIYKKQWEEVESIELISAKPYLFSHEDGLVLELPEGKYTTNFLVELEVKTKQDGSSAWNDGVNTRFVVVVPPNGKWLISRMTTSP